jgi:hypothetical protein
MTVPVRNVYNCHSTLQRDEMDHLALLLVAEIVEV